MAEGGHLLMTFSLFVLLGVLVVIMLLIFKQMIAAFISEKNPLVTRLKEYRWFHNPWIAGLFLFGINAFLFFSTVILLYLLLILIIPYVHLFVMLLAVIGSIYVWIAFNKAWSGTKQGRLKMAFIGSSFYILMCGIFICWFILLEPSYPGEDIFMAAFGLMIGIFVTTVAAVTCILFAGFAEK